MKCPRGSNKSASDALIPSIASATTHDGVAQHTTHVRVALVIPINTVLTPAAAKRRLFDGIWHDALFPYITSAAKIPTKAPMNKTNVILGGINI